MQNVLGVGRLTLIRYLSRLLLPFYIARCYKAYISPSNDSVYRKLGMFLIAYINTEFKAFKD